MKLKQSFMGIKIILGHIVFHLSMFVSTFYVDTTYKAPEYKQVSDQAQIQLINEKQNQLLIQLRVFQIIHFITPVLIIASIIMKQKQNRQLSFIFEILAMVIYLFP